MSLLKYGKRYKSLIIIFYLIILLLVLRNNFSMLKIQTEWSRDDREWKYHEWEISSVEINGVPQKMYEEYPSYEYAALKYFPQKNYEPIVIQNGEWSERAMDACVVTIAIGNTRLYSQQLPIKNGTIRVENMEKIWDRANFLYYGYYVLLVIVLGIGILGTAAAIARYRDCLSERAAAIVFFLKKKRFFLLLCLGTGAAYLFLCFLYLQNGGYFFGGSFFLQRSERCVYVGAVFLVLITSAFLLKDKRHAILVTCIAAIPLFFSLHDITLFQSKDEANNIMEQMWLSTDVFRHWSFGNARTNYLIMGTIWKLIPERYAMFGKDVHVYAMGTIEPVRMNAFQLSKLIHWGCGFVISMLMVAYIQIRLVAVKDGVHKSVCLLLLYVGLFTLPIWNLAMLNYNYDLFSMLFCVFAMILCIDYLASGRSRCKIMALLLMGFAIQEKETPIVYMLIMMAVLTACDLNKQVPKKTELIVSDFLLFFGAPLLPILATDVWVTNVLRGGCRVDDPLIHSVRIIDKMFEYLVNKISDNVNSYVSLTVMYLLVLAAGAVLAFLAQRLRRSLATEKGALVYIAWFLSIFLCTNIGVIGYKKTAPHEGAFWSNQYVSAFLENIYGYISYVPTVYIAVCMGLLAYIVMGRKRFRLTASEKMIGMASSTVIGGVTLCNVIAGCLQDMRVLSGRYQNIQQLVNAVCILLLLSIFLNGSRLLLCAAACSGMVLETVWSAPGYTLFYPVWRTDLYKDGYLIEDDWGVGNGIAGEMVEEYCIQNGIPLDGAHIYTSNLTPWGGNTYGIGYRALKSAVETKECEWDDNDFYVVFSNSISWNNVQVVIPEEIVPVMTITYKNVERAWIYQGSQLKNCYPFTEW